MPSLVYFTSSAPAKLTEVLTIAGYVVFEALEVAEVMYLCEHNKIDAIVVATDIEEQDVVEMRLQRTTIKLKPDSTLKDILWELSNIFSDTQRRVQ